MIESQIASRVREQWSMLTKSDRLVARRLLSEYVRREQSHLLHYGVGGFGPLRAELAHFAACARGQARPRSDGEAGLAVLRILEAADRSLAAEGERVPVEAG